MTSEGTSTISDPSEIDRVIGHFIPLDNRVIVKNIDGPTIDEDGYERITRINGYCGCPQCDLLWPFEEHSECWMQDSEGNWLTTEFGMGCAYCWECKIAMIDTFEGVACLEL